MVKISPTDSVSIAMTASIGRVLRRMGVPNEHYCPDANKNICIWKSLLHMLYKLGQKICCDSDLIKYQRHSILGDSGTIVEIPFLGVFVKF